MCLSTASTRAQEPGKISVPASPAFSILNFEPAAVMKPSSAKELAADVLSAFDKEGKLLLNLGMEVSPYWLKSRPTLTSRQYNHPSLGQAVIQTFKVSAATVKDSVTNNNKTGIGIRFQLMSGKPVEEYDSAVANLKKLAKINAIIISTLSLIKTGVVSNKQAVISFIATTLTKAGYSDSTNVAIVASARDLAVKYDTTRTDLAQFVIELNNKVSHDYDPLKEEVSMLSKKKKGLIMEVAGAGGFITSGGDPLDKVGVWLNISNSVSSTDAINGTLRYFYSNQDSAVTNVDVGLSYVKEEGNFSISLEAMFRWYKAEFPDKNSNNLPITRLDKDCTYRLAAQAAYRITNDISINLSVGKAFDQPFITGNSFFSVLGINYAIFKKAKIEQQ
jgi:hypothetical protein